MDTQTRTSTAASAAASIRDRYIAKGHTSHLSALKSLLQGSESLPLPGAGNTLKRWHDLAAIAAIDLSCAKLFESHHDALAILHELGEQALIQDKALWAVWCAEPPSHKVHLSNHPELPRAVYVQGVKAWCSGADAVSHALISCWDQNDKPCLVAVDMDQDAVSVGSEGWHAVGMAHTDSVDVTFDSALGTRVGEAGSYIQRPGFTHGAAGVAACWFGAAGAIALYVLKQARRRPDDEHLLAHLGTIDVALKQAACLLSSAANQIDDMPADSCELAVQRARLAVESAVETVLRRAPRALGAGPLCKNAHLAQLFADLPVFLRQSHAERDLAAHGRTLLKTKEQALWEL